MSSVIQSESAQHNSNCLKSLGTLQAAIAGTPTQATVNTNTIAYHRACLASALANSCGSDPFRAALRSLGVNA
jgi:hypothetical protein